MDKLENCTDFSGLRKMQPSSKETLIYFSIADNVGLFILFRLTSIYCKVWRLILNAKNYNYFRLRR